MLFYGVEGTPQLFMADVAAGSLSVLANVTGPYYGCSWVNDSYALYTSAVGTDPSIQLIDVNTGTAYPFLSSGGVAYVSPAVGPGSSVAYFSDQVPSTMSKAPSINSGYGFDIWLRTVTDSTSTYQYLMSSGTSCGTDDMEPVPFAPGIMDTGYGIRWNNNSTMLVYQCNCSVMGERIYLWNVVNQAISTVGPATGCNTFEPSWSPDGSQIAFSCNMNGQYHIWVTSLSGMAESAVVAGY